ncbi:MAG: helix-turn-helix domain-containing protein [Patescibacteria group bacterium]|nr:helix-turn-helix domain-containing protein [Patescibacteria group bacterium]
MECSNCGTSGDRIRFFDVVSNRGIVKLCEKCSSESGFPIVRKPAVFQLKESEKKSSVYERLSRSAGIEPGHEPEMKDKAEEILKEVVNKNYEQKLQEQKTPRSDLMDNFHWIIMRARRLKKLTQEQLAKQISEPEAAIRMAEKGIVPEGYSLIIKLEKFLGVKLRKNVSYPEEKEFSELDYEEKPEISGFDPKGLENLTISDLKRMKDEREAKIFETPSEDADEAEIFKTSSKLGQGKEEEIFENPEEDESKTF